MVGTLPAAVDRRRRRAGRAARHGRARAPGCGSTACRWRGPKADGRSACRRIRSSAPLSGRNRTLMHLPRIGSKPSRPADLAYVPAWRRDVTGAAPSGLPLDGPLVIFAGDEGLADLAEAAGVRVVEVVPGAELKREGRRLTIDIAKPEHYREAFTGLPEDGPVHVVHAWSTLRGGHRRRRAAPLDRARLRQPAADGPGTGPATRPVRLLTVSRGALDVHGGDAVAPHQAAVHGLGRVVHHEIKGLTWRGVDLDADDRRASDLAAELLAHDPEPELAARRRSRRWLQDWAELPVGESSRRLVCRSLGRDRHRDGSAESLNRAATPWRPEGTYLITGGTRGLGLTLANHLVAPASASWPSSVAAAPTAPLPASQPSKPPVQRFCSSPPTLASPTLCAPPSPRPAATSARSPASSTPRASPPAAWPSGAPSPMPMPSSRPRSSRWDRWPNSSVRPRPKPSAPNSSSSTPPRSPSSAASARATTAPPTPSSTPTPPPWPPTPRPPGWSP